MSCDLNRRQLLLAGGAAWLGAGAMSRVLAAAQGSTKKVLFFTKSSGFQHSVITRKGDKPGPGRADPDRDRQGARLRGRRIQGRPPVRARPDRPVGRLRLRDHRRPDHARAGDKNPPISPDGEKAFYDAIRGGKGFMGMHCATDTFGHHRQAEQGSRGPVHPDDRRRVHHPWRRSRTSRSRSSTPSSPAWPRDSARRASRSRSTTNGMPSRTCPTTCT